LVRFSLATPEAKKGYTNVIGLLGKKLAIYLAAVLTTYLLATAAASLHVASRLASMGVTLDLAGRLSMILQDIAGMAGMFLPLIALALLIAFVVTALLVYLLRRGRIPLYVLAGAAAMLALHFTMNAVFGLTAVAVARSAGGLLTQALAGAVGGFVYVCLNRRFGERIIDTLDA
jgi:hypothetical protein